MKHQKSDDLRQITSKLDGKFKTTNANSYPLIFCLNQYKKSITNLAIGCIKRQNIIAKAVGVSTKPTYFKQIKPSEKIHPNYKKKEVLETLQLNSADENKQNTIKKKYNYRVTLNSQENHSTQKLQMKQNNSLQPSKSHSNYPKSAFGNNCSNNCTQKNGLHQEYITKPFQIGHTASFEQFHTDKYSFQKKRLSFHKKLAQNHQNKAQNTKQQALKDLQIIRISRPNINGKDQSNSAKRSQKAKKKLKSAIDSNQNEKMVKKVLSINYRTQQLQGVSSIKKVKIQQKIKSTEKQTKYPKMTYSKTETYTSRSDYKLDRLSNKLDSYINKHIQHQQKQRTRHKA